MATSPGARYGYYSGRSAPGELNLGRAVLLDVQVVTGPEGALLRIGNNPIIDLPGNFSFCTDSFPDCSSNPVIQLTGDVVFYFISFAQ